MNNNPSETSLEANSNQSVSSQFDMKPIETTPTVVMNPDNPKEGVNEGTGSQPLDEVHPRYTNVLTETPSEIESVPMANSTHAVEAVNGVLKTIATMNETQQAQLRYLLNHSDRVAESELNQRQRKRRMSEVESIDAPSDRRTRLRITAPEKFDGKDQKRAEDFIQQVEHYFRLIKDQIPNESYQIDLFGTFLKDSSWDWFINFIQTPEHLAAPKWISMREAFHASFASSERKLQALDKLELPQ
jgi:hypothetical protein